MLFKFFRHKKDYFLFIDVLTFNPHTYLQKKLTLPDMWGPADPKNCMIWYKR